MLLVGFSPMDIHRYTSPSNGESGQSNSTDDTRPVLHNQNLEQTSSPIPEMVGGGGYWSGFRCIIRGG